MRILRTALIVFGLGVPACYAAQAAGIAEDTDNIFELKKVGGYTPIHILTFKTN